MSKASILSLIEAGSFRKRFTQLVLFLRFAFRGVLCQAYFDFIKFASQRYTFFNTPNLPFGAVAIMGNPPQKVRTKFKEA